MATQLRYPKGHAFFDNNGALLASGTLRYDRATTTTLQNVYSDAAGATALPNPVTLNSAGRAVDGGGTTVAIYLKDLGFDYKESIANSAGTVLYTDDNIAEPVDLAASLSDTAKPRIQYSTDTAASVSLTAAELGSGRLASSGSNSITYAPISASAAGNGNGFLIKKTSASNTVTFDPDGTDTVDGAATFAWTEDDRAYWFISDGANWQVSVAYLANLNADDVTPTMSTVQRFTLGTAATYTPTAGTKYIRVRMVGGGGGGGAVATNAGSVGTDTSFGSWTAIHGNGGAAAQEGVAGANGGAGGTGGATGTGTLIMRLDGQQGGSLAGTGTSGVGGYGGSSAFGGGAAAMRGAGGAGLNAKANTGSGGGGGHVSASNGGDGGGAGEYVEFFVSAPGAITYTVGTGGAGGAAGTAAGGNGAAGIIIVEEHY